MAWKDLSMSQRAEVIGMAVKSDLRDMASIRKFYDDSIKGSGREYEEGSKPRRFAEGGDTNPHTVGATVDALYASYPREEYLGEPSHHYDFTQSEEWADAHGYYPDARGHRDDRVKKPAHPSHPSRGTWNGDKFELTDFGMQNPNYTLFGLNDGGQDPQAILTYKGGIVLPEITVTPKENYVFNPYDNIILHQKALGGPLVEAANKYPIGGYIDYPANNAIHNIGAATLTGKYSPGGIRVPYANADWTNGLEGYINPQLQLDYYANWLDNRRQVLEQNMKDTGTYPETGFIDRLKNWKAGYENGRIALNKEIYSQLNRAANSIYQYDDPEYNPVLQENELGRTIINSNGLADVYINPNLDNKTTSSNILHELSHAANSPATANGVYLENSARSPQERKIEQLGIKLRPLNIDEETRKNYPYFVRQTEAQRKYLSQPSEIYARMMQFRFENNLDPNHKYTKEEVAPLLKKSSITGIGEYNIDDFVRALNEVAYNYDGTPDNIVAEGGLL